MPGPSPNARTVNHGKTLGPLAAAIDALPVWSEQNDTSHWAELWAEGFNHIPAALTYAMRRNPGREFVWEYEDTGVRIWRTK